ncbi:MAG: preprotein translocase subunit SecG [Deltaproteobacteria bacterium]|nr:preprotein translocase subunit SecG [Deltaproteobacteria bacterium]
MTILITVVHVIACIVLVLVVLLQAGKGADMGAVFGGASSTIFGSSGAGNFLTRLTTGAAVVFMTTSLALTYVGSHGGHSTIMPESGLPSAAPAEPATDAGGAADPEAAAVADSAPAAAPAEGGAAPAAQDEAAAPAGEAAPAPQAAPADEPAPAAP